MEKRLWRIVHANTSVYVRRMAKRNGFQCGASAAATALIAEVFVAGIAITMLPSTFGPICCTICKMVHGHSSSINISSINKMMMKPPLLLLQ